LLGLIANNLLDGEQISDNVWRPILNILLVILFSFGCGGAEAPFV